jgi:hypothetical protein
MSEIERRSLRAPGPRSGPASGKRRCGRASIRNSSLPCAEAAAAALAAIRGTTELARADSEFISGRRGANRDVASAAFDAGICRLAARYRDREAPEPVIPRWRIVRVAACALSRRRAG